jgi:hypothetical protein
MRSFTNREGERVTVSEEHLSTAVKIKKALQDASPSRKCSWVLLVNLMEQEGFYDAENSENYRSMIKYHQKSLGELPTAAAHAELVSGNKLESIKNMVGELAYEKRETQHILKEYNKTKRELMDYSLMAEQVGAAFANHDWSKYSMKTPSLRHSATGKKMIACLSDMHIGALVNTAINRFNYEVALERLTEYASHLILNAKDNDISEIHVVNLGDVVEHSNMRYGQAYHSEFTYSEQLPLASDAIIKFLVLLAEEGFSVSYSGIAGNHDRANDKDKNIHGDHAVKPINHMVKIFCDNAKLDNLKYAPAFDDYSHRLTVNGIHFKFVHGDLDSCKDEKLVAKHSDLDRMDYSAIVSGHVHHFRDLEVGLRKRIIVFGSLKGPDDYGEKIRKLSVASQGFITVDADGKIDVKRIELT